MNTLSIDIGGSKVKATVLDDAGKLLNDYVKLPTPSPATPANILQTVKTLVKDFQYDRVSCGFPGYVRNGVVYTAPNLGTNSWANTDWAKMLSESLGKPAKVANDADMLGLGVIDGKGFEMVVTLGTGVGTSFYMNGKLLPHFELAHHPLRKELDYDQYIGYAAMQEKGKAKWNDRVAFALGVIKTVVNYDKLYLGGGNTKFITFPLDKNIVVFTNLDGIDGGVKLWDAADFAS